MRSVLLAADVVICVLNTLCWLPMLHIHCRERS